MNQTLIKQWATCEYISQHRSIFITGATGSGKTYMACALGMGPASDDIPLSEALPDRNKYDAYKINIISAVRRTVDL